MEYLRNKQTGEFMEVERDTPEWIALTQQVGPDGRSLYEQTGSHHVGAVSERADERALREEDLGHADQPIAPLKVDTNAVGPAIAPWLELTAAEREAGLTDESKAEGVADDIEAARAEARSSTFEDAAERIAESTGDSFPVKTTTEPVDEGAKKADLVEAAEARGLDSSGTKADLLERIQEHDRDHATV